ncbi:MAG: PQQ-binding-like beta-propeller repeat protein [Planctomycetota bacterium]
MILPIALLALPLSSGDVAWPSFRGPQGNGLVDAHPLSWSEESNVAWKVDVPGGGWSSPVVADGVVYVTTAIQTDKEDGGRPLGFAASVRMPASRGAGADAPEGEVVFQVRAYSLETGELKWEKDLARRVPKHGIHPSNTFATESPATDGERVVCYFGAIGLVACVDLKGEVVWSKETGEHKTGNDFGTGSAVALADGKAFIQCDNAESSFAAAFNVADGEEIWRVDRSTGTAWASPILWQHGDVRDLVMCGPGYVTGYDPATGDVRWNVTGVGGSFSSSPGSDDERLIFGNSGPGRRGPLFAISSNVEGEVDLGDDESQHDALAWRLGRAGPAFSSPVSVGGLLYIVNGQGILTCRDVATGDELYEERLPDARSVVSSMWTDGEHVFVLAEGGQTYVIAVSPEFEVVETNAVDGIFWSTPSAANGSLLLRSATSLYCVRDKG